jgi:hypothetical protein
MARHGKAGQGKELAVGAMTSIPLRYLGRARRGEAWHGWARHGVARHGKELAVGAMTSIPLHYLGPAWLGMAWHGWARHGRARHGKELAVGPFRPGSKRTQVLELAPIRNVGF